MPTLKELLDELSKYGFDYKVMHEDDDSIWLKFDFDPEDEDEEETA